MSTLVLTSGIWFGYEFTTLIIKNRLEYLVRISIGACFGIAFQSFVFFIASLFHPLNRFLCIVISLAIYVISVILALWNKQYKPSRRIRYSVLDLFVLILSSIFIGSGVYYANIEDGYYTRGPAYADLPFHMNIISSFSQGINYNRTSLFDVWSCFQADIMLAYPMFHNFYIAVLINCNDISLSAALQITAVILSICFIILLYETFYTFTSDRIIADISIPTWILLGGLGYTMVFYPEYYKQRANNWILRFSETHHTTWMQPLVQILIPQRSALFSAPLCLTCLICFMKGVRRWETSFFILSGMCTSFLPQIQVHSFVAIAQFAIATCLLFFPQKEKFWSAFFSWLIYMFCSCLFGLPLTYPFWIRQNENGSSFIRFDKLWGDDVYGKLVFPLITVWWKGLGPFGMVMILFGWVAAKDSNQMKFWGASMVVWLITSFIMYQPWKMDNIKLLFAVWVPIAVPYVTQFYVYIWRKTKNNYMKAIIIFLMIQNMFSSILSFNSELFKRLILMQVCDYHCGNWISENTPIDSIFMSYSSRFNPATALAGRQLYHGFISWTAQHGVSGPNRELKVSKLLADTNNADFFASEAISYVLVKWNTTFVFPIKGKDTPWIKVYYEHPYTIYKLNHSNIALPEHKRNSKDLKSFTANPMKTPIPQKTKRKKQIIYNFD
ncbi:hypothetical protein TRFO_07979 [Tritrichomonas foetus]|uniref:Uncharacterized protein n=1 Tax=Tritrichomonas foetus TaxID=1144522 RepID=A0A1J4JML6_9EUKA|nr:hypothetical protein TRFO_07979 [Tritrichomonas foetus]|eukprot:OHT00315.1 hypothetical protein TRFO_07979 [Tritrichomonas foetus]